MVCILLAAENFYPFRCSENRIESFDIRSLPQTFQCSQLQRVENVYKSLHSNKRSHTYTYVQAVSQRLCASATPWCDVCEIAFTKRESKRESSEDRGREREKERSQSIHSVFDILVQTVSCVFVHKEKYCAYDCLMTEVVTISVIYNLFHFIDFWHFISSKIHVCSIFSVDCNSMQWEFGAVVAAQAEKKLGYRSNECVENFVVLFLALFFPAIAVSTIAFRSRNSSSIHN